MLHDPRVHEPLAGADWDPARAEDAIRAIARDADSALRADDWWPLHPLDEDGDTLAVAHGIYFGAAGVLWALDRLARAGLHEPAHDYARLAATVLDSYRRRPELDGPAAGLWIGAAGIALVAWLLAPGDAPAAPALTVPEPDTLELMWGSPGLLLVADALLERTGDERWADAWRAIADRLLRARGARVPGFWTQDLYGSERELLGPAHGLAGVVAALARRPELLPVSELAPATTAALAATAVRAGGLANWPPQRGGPLADNGNAIRTQWCHGAPGMVASTATLPREPELDALLLAGGELTWVAGPLRKGASLCHGTAGNGFALLKLFARTGDERWLERARQFAMHAAGQVAATRERYGRGRHSLWTGDLGSALYLHECLTGGAAVPTIDCW